MSNAVGRNLSALISLRNTSQSAVASVAAASNGAVSHWISGRSRPKDEYLERICDYYSVSMDDLTSERYGLYSRLHAPAPDGAALVSGRPAATVPVRVLGATYAGEPSDPPTFDGEAMLYESLVSEHPNCYALEVVGSCMDRCFTESDHIFVDPDAELSDGCIAVMLIDGKTEARRVRRGNNCIMLVSESHNPQPDIVLRADSDAVCQGVVFFWQSKRAL